MVKEGQVGGKFIYRVQELRAGLLRRDEDGDDDKDEDMEMKMWR